MHTRLTGGFALNFKHVLLVIQCKLFFLIRGFKKEINKENFLVWIPLPRERGGNQRIPKWENWNTVIL